MIWVYAICERSAGVPPGAVGLGGAPLEGIGERELMAVTTRHAEVPDTRSVDALWTHEQVVERLMAGGPVLPFRFGSRLASAAAIRRELAIRREELLLALERVRDRVELGVRAVRSAEPSRPSEPAPDQAPTGRGYLRAKLALRDGLEETAAALHAPLAAVAAADTRRPAPIPREVLRGSYLVDRAAVGKFRSVTKRLQREHPEVALLCTGPWPPYSFVEVPWAGRSARRQGARG